MSPETADIVLSLRGRDAGSEFFVLQADGETALLCDGRARRVEKPKRKNLRHISFVRKGEGRTAEKLRAGEKVTNGEIRRALRAPEA